MYKANKGSVLILCPDSLIPLLDSSVVVILRIRLVCMCKDIRMLKLKAFWIDGIKGSNFLYKHMSELSGHLILICCICNTLNTV